MISCHCVANQAFGWTERYPAAVKITFKARNMTTYSVWPTVGAFPRRYGRGRTWYDPISEGQTIYGLSLSYKPFMYGRWLRREKNTGVPKPTTNRMMLKRSLGLRATDTTEKEKWERALTHIENEPSRHAQKTLASSCLTWPSPGR